MDAVLSAAIKRRDDALKQVSYWNDFIEKYNTLANEKSIHLLNQKIIEILQDTPMSTGLLLNKLREEKIDIPGKDPWNTLSARLSRMKEIKWTKELGWILREKINDPTAS